jgi:hypothetical protein
MPDPALRVVAVVLAATFAWAAIAKIVRWSRWTTALAGYGLRPAPGRVAAPLVPLAEGAVAGLVVAGLARAGAALAVGLLAAFSGALLYARERRGDRLPCGCFGGAGDRDYRSLLWRNAGLGVLAAAVLVAPHDVVLTEGFSIPSAGELVPAALIVAGVGVGAWTVWQVGSSFGRGRSR